MALKARHKSLKARSNRSKLANSLTWALLASLLIPMPASASTQVYEFESDSDLTDNFIVTVGPNTNRSDISVQAEWGIDATGGLKVDLGNPTENRAAILGSQVRYTVNGAPVDSVYKFSLYAKSFEGGYAGMGFSANSTVTSSGVYPDRFTPTDALGVSLHGGGFFIHNGNTDIEGQWNGSGNPVAITPITTSSCLIFIDSPEFVPSPASLDDCASSSGWYRMDLTLTKKGPITFDLKIEVFRSSSSGDIAESGNSNPDASFEVLGLSNSAIGNADSLASYINYSGKRFPAIDRYSVTLTGGPSFVTAPSAPGPQSPNNQSRSNYFVVEGFKKSKARLTNSMKDFIEQELSGMNGESRIVCTGTVRGSKWTAKREALALARATAGCDYVETLLPSVETELKKRLISKKKQNSLTVRISVFKTQSIAPPA